MHDYVRYSKNGWAPLDENKTLDGSSYPRKGILAHLNIFLATKRNRLCLGPVLIASRLIISMR